MITRRKLKMINHYIIVKWNNLLENKDSIVEEVKRIFDKTLSIDGVHKVEVLKNVINRENRFDLMIKIEMEKEALDLYDKSEPHKEWKEKFNKFILSKTIFDSE